MNFSYTLRRDGHAFCGFEFASDAVWYAIAQPGCEIWHDGHPVWRATDSAPTVLTGLAVVQDRITALRQEPPTHSGRVT